MNDFNLREYLKHNPLLKEDVDIVKGFKEFDIDDEPDTEEDFEVRSFGAPMEGWDEEHYDYINIFSTATSDPDTGEELKPRYYVDVYVSYGDWTKERTYYDTEEEAYGEVEYIMNDFKEDWEDIDDEVYGESKTLNEDLSSKFMNKYLSEFNAEDFEIEDIESYSDRDKAIFAYLEIGPGIIVKDEVAKAIKDKSGEEILQYFQDKNYSYMPYSEMRRIFKVAPVQGMVWDESGAKDTPWYFYPNHVRKLNKIWREKYPELNIPKLQYEFKSAITDDLEELYRGQARQQKGQDLEISYEEYADAFADGVKEKVELSETKTLNEGTLVDTLIDGLWYVS